MDTASTLRHYWPWLVALAALGLLALPYDAQVAGWLNCRTAADPALTALARFFSTWALWVFYVGFGLAFVVGLLQRDAGLVRLGLAYGLTLLIFSLAVGHVLKVAVGRPRPWVGDGLACRPLTFEARYNSFPSGHTSDAFAALPPALSWLRSAGLQAAMAVWAVLIALSRVMLGQHYPSDILAGAFLSLAGGALICGVLERRLPDSWRPNSWGGRA
jgi:membrane-associated phospholipid phosphatase